MESEILTEMNEKIVRDFLDVVILMELRKHSMSGYDVIGHVRKRFNVLMSSGAVYPYLYSMEREGLIRGECSQSKRVFTLTERGEERIKVLLKMRNKILGLVLNLFIEE